MKPKTSKDSIYFYPGKFEVNKERMPDDDKMLKEKSFDTKSILAFQRKRSLRCVTSKRSAILSGINDLPGRNSHKKAQDAEW
jgi:hypothetical protein